MDVDVLNDLLKFVSHEHPLFLKDESQKKHSNGECQGCGQEISLFGPSYYDCNECNYSLHQICAKLPKQIKHWLSPHDTLYLLSTPGVVHGRSCQLCKGKLNKFTYTSVGYLFLHAKCAAYIESSFLHPSHQHPLTHLSRPIVTLCDACGTKHEGIFCQCTTCDKFWIHRDCALLPTTLTIQATTTDRYYHDHELSLAYSLPDHHGEIQRKCEICDKELNRHNWLYTCCEEESQCNYFCHVNCATSNTEPFMSIFFSPGKPPLPSSYPNVLRLPFPNESHSLIRHNFFVRKRSQEKDGYIVDVVAKGFAHDHPLILSNVTSDEIDEGFSSSSRKLVYLHHPIKKTKLLCYVCVKPLREDCPYYMCTNNQCRDFILHKWCAKIKIFGHPQPEARVLFSTSECPVFIMKKKKCDSFTPSFGLFKCTLCGLKFNGLGFRCTDCKLTLDVNCRHLPTTIVHESHPDHFLYLRQSSSNHLASPCRACSYDRSDELKEFGCAICNFKLHIRCALLPGTISHRYDQHPLNLTYTPLKNHIPEYFCEICEEKLDPNNWFYHCVACNQSMHAGCASLYNCGQSLHSRYVSRFDSSANIKFGGNLNIESHPHPLSFVRMLGDNTTCGVCSKPGDMLADGFNYGFRCLKCKYALHYDCASTLLCEKNWWRSQLEDEQVYYRLTDFEH